MDQLKQKDDRIEQHKVEQEEQKEIRKKMNVEIADQREQIKIL